MVLGVQLNSSNWLRQEDEIIDLWGVRSEIATVLPATPLIEIPGISQPREFDNFSSIEPASADPEGTVLLAAFGQTRLYAAARAMEVAVEEAALNAAAAAVAATLGGEDPSGKPGALYRRIPHGERVWNMKRGAQRHSRLTDEPWVTPRLGRDGAVLIDYLGGNRADLPLG